MASSGDNVRFGPGTSVLGGAAGGLSYEGCLRDAIARDERARRQQAGQRRPVPPQQQQAARPDPAPRDAKAARQMMA
jgi:hypothetical protein